jgi:rsbT co-antagonist protein RsbR
MNKTFESLHDRTYTDTIAHTALYDIQAEDLKEIAEVGHHMIPRIPEMIDKFYEWAFTVPEIEEFFTDEEVLLRVKAYQQDYWVAFFQGDLGDGYIENLQSLGETHARIGLSMPTYFASMSRIANIVARMMSEDDSTKEIYDRCAGSVSKLLSFDTGIVVDAFNHLVGETISNQSQSLMEMSTPVTEIWNGILLLPVVGIIDSKRSQDIMNATLKKISDTQAKIFILDISGVGVVDTAVANHLIKVTRATSLMGCKTTISGLSPSIAQTIVELGIDVGSIKTTSTMMDALADAFSRLGMSIQEVR